MSGDGKHQGMVFRKVVAVMLVLLFVPMVLPQADAATGGGYRVELHEGVMPWNMVYAGAAFDGSHVYLLGGTEHGRKIVQYDSIARIHEVMGSTFPLPQEAMKPVATDAGIFTFGGLNRYGTMQPVDVRLYDPGDDSLTDTGANMAYVYDKPKVWDGSRYIYIFGSPDYINEVTRYDTQTDTWSKVGTSLPCICRAEFAFWWDGAAYAFAGHPATIYRYDPDSNTIDAVKSTAFDYLSNPVAWSGEHLYILGVTETNQHSGNMVQRLDPLTMDLEFLPVELPSWVDDNNPAVWDGVKILVFERETAGDGGDVMEIHVPLPSEVPQLTAGPGPLPGQIKLWWSEPESGAALIAGYRIFRAQQNGPFEAVADSVQRSFTDEGLVPGARYQYQVAAITRDEQEGPRSEPVSQRAAVTPGAVDGDQDLVPDPIDPFLCGNGAGDFIFGQIGGGCSDEGDFDSGIPAYLFGPLTGDQDGDLLPDAAERAMCDYLQYEHLPQDGDCVGGDYFAPDGEALGATAQGSSFPLVGVEAGDDVDVALGEEAQYSVMVTGLVPHRDYLLAYGGGQGVLAANAYLAPDGSGHAMFGPVALLPGSWMVMDGASVVARLDVTVGTMTTTGGWGTAPYQPGPSVHCPSGPVSWLGAHKVYEGSSGGPLVTESRSDVVYREGRSYDLYRGWMSSNCITSIEEVVEDAFAMGLVVQGASKAAAYNDWSVSLAGFGYRDGSARIEAYGPTLLLSDTAKTSVEVDQVVMPDGERRWYHYLLEWALEKVGGFMASKAGIPGIVMAILGNVAADAEKYHQVLANEQVATGFDPSGCGEGCVQWHALVTNGYSDGFGLFVDLEPTAPFAPCETDTIQIQMGFERVSFIETYRNQDLGGGYQTTRDSRTFEPLEPITVDVPIQFACTTG